MKNSEDYLKWVKDSEIKNLTGTQSDFAEWLLTHKERLTVIGDIESIFKSIRKWLKEQK